MFRQSRYVNIKDPLGPHRWIYNDCNAVIQLKKSKSTSNVTHHLSSVHQIIFKRGVDEMNEEREDESQAQDIT